MYIYIYIYIYLYIFIYIIHILDICIVCKCYLINKSLHNNRLQTRFN